MHSSAKVAPLGDTRRMRDAQWNNRQVGHADEIGRGHSAPVDRPPRELAEAGGWILARAALRLPVLGFSLFYLVQGLPTRGRWSHFPDGASFLWLCFAMVEPDSLALRILGFFAGFFSGEWWLESVVWVVGYSLVTVAHVGLGWLLMRRRPLVRRMYRTVVVVLAVQLVVAVLALLVVAPYAFEAVRTGENAPVVPYVGESLVHAYEWLLLPWAVALTTTSVVALVLLRRPATRRYVSDGDTHPAATA
jgi:hypothetical protein